MGNAPREAGLDPRFRIVLALIGVCVFLSLRRHSVLLALVAVLFVACAATPGIGVSVLRRRLIAVNVFSLMLLALMPWGTLGEALFSLGGVGYMREGALHALRIALKANAAVLLMTWLLTPVDPMVLGQAVAGLGAPQRLVHLYVLTLRYLRVLEDEYQRLRRAMHVRGFRARANLHTLRSFGYLVGMLLIRALDRAERVWQAMLCRGFSGQFSPMHARRVRKHDVALACGALVALGVVFGIDRGVAPW